MMTGRSMSCSGPFAVGAAAADAALAIINDTPAAPSTGKAVVRRFRFEPCFARAIVKPPDLPADARRMKLSVAFFVRLAQGRRTGAGTRWLWNGWHHR